MLKKFTKYITQSVAGMIGISIYVLADTFFISVYSGADGLAVLNLILPVYGLIYAIGSMIGIGSATRYAINKAKGENTDHYFVQSVTWSIIIAIPFMLIGIFIPDKALALLGADAGLIRLGRNYLRIILIATPFFMSNYTFTAFARNDGAPSTAMIGSISGSMFNIIFDYIFIFPAGLGFSGAALATAICPLVTMSICTTHYRSRRNHVIFGWKKAITQTPDFLLPAWRFCLCRRNVLRCDSHRIQLSDPRNRRKRRGSRLRSCSKPLHRSSSNLQRPRSGCSAIDQRKLRKRRICTGKKTPEMESRRVPGSRSSHSAGHLDSD